MQLIAPNTRFPHEIVVRLQLIGEDWPNFGGWRHYGRWVVRHHRRQCDTIGDKVRLGSGVAPKTVEQHRRRVMRLQRR